MFDKLVSAWGRVAAGTSVPPPEERRVWVRHPSDREAVFQAADAPERGRLSARVRDISRGGISFVVEEHFAPGTLLCVELPGNAGPSTSAILAYVIRVVAQPDGGWALGCSFASELTEDDL